jgi:methylmalonyl-CoA mutase, C-terminal domain
MPVTLRRHTSVVVFVGDSRASDRGAQALAHSLRDAGVEILYLGREPSPRRIAAAAADACADAVEVCVAGGGAVVLLRNLLRELNRLDRRHVSIVVHRVR